jgi:hypothetical protein
MNICRTKGITCSLTTEYGYCRVTACVRISDTQINCNDCIYYVPLRQLTSDEAKAVHKGILIDVRGCCLGVCRFERRGENDEIG